MPDAKADTQEAVNKPRARELYFTYPLSRCGAAMGLAGLV